MKSFLTEIEKTVMTMHYSGLKRREIAIALNKSMDAIRKIEDRAWLKYKKSFETIDQWEEIETSGLSMKKIANSPIKHSLADMMG